DRGVADRPRAKEELFKFAIDATPHRSDAEAVADDFRTYSARAIVDGEIISSRRCGSSQVGVFAGQLEKRLHRGVGDLVINHRDLTIGLFPIGRDRVGAKQRVERGARLAGDVAGRLRFIRTGRSRKPSGFGTGYNRSQVRMVQVQIVALLHALASLRY